MPWVKSIPSCDLCGGNIEVLQVLNTEGQTSSVCRACMVRVATELARNFPDQYNNPDRFNNPDRCGVCRGPGGSRHPLTIKTDYGSVAFSICSSCFNQIFESVPFWSRLNEIADKIPPKSPASLPGSPELLDQINKLAEEYARLYFEQIDVSMPLAPAPDRKFIAVPVQTFDVPTLSYTTSINEQFDALYNRGYSVWGRQIFSGFEIVIFKRG